MLTIKKCFSLNNAFYNNMFYKWTLIEIMIIWECRMNSIRAKLDLEDMKH